MSLIVGNTAKACSAGNSASVCVAWLGVASRDGVKLHQLSLSVRGQVSFRRYEMGMDGWKGGESGT